MNLNVQWYRWTSVCSEFTLTLKVGLGILQITSAKRCPHVWPWVGRSLLLNLIKRCSNQHAEIFMNETNMRRFESVFTNRITSSWHQKSKISKRIVLFDCTFFILVTQISHSQKRGTVSYHIVRW